MSATGRILLAIATIVTFHAAFSTYEHLSRLKALGRPESGIPNDVAMETLFGLCMGILGASLSAPPLKEITWASEMRKHKIDEMDARTGFASYVNRGRKIFAQSSPE
ncbi:hypothetical protein BDN72DRAFT_800985 [Pluteus cervinus]|uniref:Uncharacterized protein n=1 Tax=Pluteus cervinus TaxID=181527 RepID=A0ACD3AIM4_9AGAR|nr:hypothetical protein BDN72DRAFT_800985 [Pluteus cervinus]